MMIYFPIVFPRQITRFRDWMHQKTEYRFNFLYEEGHRETGTGDEDAWNNLTRLTENRVYSWRFSFYMYRIIASRMLGQSRAGMNGFRHCAYAAIAPLCHFWRDDPTSRERLLASLKMREIFECSSVIQMSLEQ